MELLEKDGSPLSDADALRYSKVGRILATPQYRTEEIITRLLDAALLAPKQPEDILRKRARKLLSLIARHGERTVPVDELELVCLSTLTQAEERGRAEDIEIPKPKEVPQFERTCIGCGRHFVARRKNQEFHSDRCHIKAGEKYEKAGVIPSGWKACAVCLTPFKSERGNALYCPKTVCGRSGNRKSAKEAVLVG